MNADSCAMKWLDYLTLLSLRCQTPEDTQIINRNQVLNSKAGVSRVMANLVSELVVGCAFLCCCSGRNDPSFTQSMLLGSLRWTIRSIRISGRNIISSLMHITHFLRLKFRSQSVVKLVDTPALIRQLQTWNRSGDGLQSYTSYAIIVAALHYSTNC